MSDSVLVQRRDPLPADPQQAGMLVQSLVDDLNEEDDQQARCAILKEIIQVLVESRDLRAAIDFQRQLVEDSVPAFGDMSKEYLDAKSALAGLYHKSGQLHLAQPELEDVLRVTKAVYGDRHLTYFFNLYKLGTLCHSRGDFDYAYRIHLRARDLALILLPAERVEIANCAINIGRAFLAHQSAKNAQVGPPEDLLPILEDALHCPDIAASATETGKIHMMMADTNMILADPNAELECVRKAIEAFERSADKSSVHQLSLLRDREQNLIPKQLPEKDLEAETFEDSRSLRSRFSLSSFVSRSPSTSTASTSSATSSGSDSNPKRTSSFFARMFPKRENSQGLDLLAENDRSSMRVEPATDPKAVLMSRGATNTLRGGGRAGPSPPSSSVEDLRLPARASRDRSSPPRCEVIPEGPPKGSVPASRTHSSRSSMAEMPDHQDAPTRPAGFPENAAIADIPAALRPERMSSREEYEMRQSHSQRASSTIPSENSSRSASPQMNVSVVKGARSMSETMSSSMTSQLKQRERELREQLQASQDKISELRRQVVDLAGKLEMSEARCETLEVTTRQAQLSANMFNSRSRVGSQGASEQVSYAPVRSSSAPQPTTANPVSSTGDPARQLAALSGDKAVLSALSCAELEAIINVHQQALIATQSAVLEARERALREKLSAEVDKQDKNSCKICLDECVEVVLQPCNHAVLCIECARGVQICPICRAPIRNRLHIFI
eukprot:m.336280 g.336280  ORF g.336280 m.336280 type:complete len:728 (-) comp55695_c0_seq1:381-2564(-)